MFSRILGIFLMGIVIKLMDDFLDKEIDKECKQWNSSLLLGRSILPYTILLSIIALKINYNEAAAIFAAAYFIGMLHSYRGLLPTKLKGWQEGLIVVIIFIFLISLKEVVAAILIVTIIQIIDDMIDYKKEKFLNQNNTISIIGRYNTVIVFLIILFITIFYFPIKLLYYLIAVASLYLCFFILEKYDRTD